MSHTTTTSSVFDVSRKYKKKTQREHVLLRPVAYVGSVERTESPQWIWKDGKMQWAPKLPYVPGLFKIYDEVIVNATDNRQRDKSTNTIKVDIDRQQGCVSVYNNGPGIPVQKHTEYGIYIVELVFGHMFTSSNYDDEEDEESTTGGQNGIGAKATCIFSTRFIVETVDSENQLWYRQEFRDNQLIIDPPQIKKCTKASYTKVTFYPDWERFGMNPSQGFDDDHFYLFSRRVIDLAGTNDKSLKVFLNGERVQVKGFVEYVQLFSNALSPINNNDNDEDREDEQDQKEQNDEKEQVQEHEQEEKKDDKEHEEAKHEKTQKEQVNVTSRIKPIADLATDRWQIAILPNNAIHLSSEKCIQLSFVNHISTFRGGTHVNHVEKQIVDVISEFLQKKHKEIHFTPQRIKKHFAIFVNCIINKPKFDSATKEKLLTRKESWGSTFNLSEKTVKAICNSEIMNSIVNFGMEKQEKKLQKQNGKKKQRLTGIPKLEDAADAGGPNSENCTLILCEGDSAKALIVSGLAVVGRATYGVYPVKGKGINCLKASLKTIMANKEIQDIVQILGLKHGQVYNSVKSLRYGKIMLGFDNDLDAAHIKGLFITLFMKFWPSLLTIPNFISYFITPIIVAKRRSDEIWFYSQLQYQQWFNIHQNESGWETSYKKGLGTSTAADAKKYFSNLKFHQKFYAPATPEDFTALQLAFVPDKKHDNARKDWIASYTPGTYLDHSQDAPITYNDFVNKELIQFSIADNLRSIPSAIDGQKNGQRKILYGCIKRNLTKEAKVAQLSGYIAEHSNYHHGEASLNSTIVGMAQNFVGSNNINILYPKGQFGTRHLGGKDHASARYIFTYLNPVSRCIFHPEDDDLLTYVVDDGDIVEPQWYIPIIPMVLVNGSAGIGTGWSSNLPNFSPVEIVANLKRMMDKQEPTTMHPWYRGFRGQIAQKDSKTYTCHGVITKINPTTLEISELPIQKWTNSYKEFLEKKIAEDEIYSFTEGHTDTNVLFTIIMTDEQMIKAESFGLEAYFDLMDTISINNMVLFDSKGKLKKYENCLDILKEFFPIRLEFYHKRKRLMQDKIQKKLSKLSNKIRFLSDILSEALNIRNVKKHVIVQYLTDHQFDLFPSKPNSNDGYDYLLDMTLSSLTFERFEALKKEELDQRQELSTIESQDVLNTWRHDLDEFMSALEKYEQGELALQQQSEHAPVSEKTKRSRKPKRKDTSNNNSDSQLSKKCKHDA